MLGPALAKLMAVIADGYDGWPWRWKNEAWPADMAVDAGGKPRGPGGEAVVFIEAEILGGRNRLAAFSTPGSRVFIHGGLLRCYLHVPFGAGMQAATDEGDVLAAMLQRQRFIIDPAIDRYIDTQDTSTADGVASDENSAYAVLMLSTPFDFYYRG